MAGTYRHQTLIDAPIEDVWAVISDPLTHPDWWPDVVAVRIEEPLVEGGEYIRSSKLLPFRDAAEAVWVAERLEDLKEARFRCRVSGTWAHFKLTPAQAETFVELETGMSWLMRPTMPIVPATAVRPSSSGRPAATSAPNASSRISRVMGSDSVSAFWRSVSNAAMSSFSELASPNWAT